MVTPVKPATVADIELADPDGRQVLLRDYAAAPLVVVLVRYFGCLPCQHYLADLNGMELPEGARVVAVGGSSAQQAQWLRDKKGVEIPLLLDAAQRVRSVAQLGTLSMRQLSKGKGLMNYARALRNGFRPQVPTQDINQAPGIAIFDTDFNLEWVHRGEVMGDYPPIPNLIERMSS